MTKEQFDNYSFSVNTEVKFRGKWSKLTEVWFDEGLLGIKNTGHLVAFIEIEDIKN